MTNVTATRTKVWRKDRERKDGSQFHTYSIGVSSKNQDGSYTNMYLPVKFTKKAEVPEKLPNGIEGDLEGFLSVDSYRDKDGNEAKNLQFVVTKAFFDPDEVNEKTNVAAEDMTDSFEQLEEDLPF